MKIPEINTTEALEDRLSEDLAWRKVELHRIRTKIQESDDEITVKAGFIFLYAHWEGYIEWASNCYFNFVKHQHLTYNQLEVNWITFSILKDIQNSANSKKIEDHNKIVEKILLSGDTEVHFPTSLYIETGYNLTYDRLNRITFILGLDISEYASKRNKIDETLVKTRGDIAHGKRLKISLDEFIELYDIIIELLDNFKERVLDAAIKNRFRRDLVQPN